MTGVGYGRIIPLAILCAAPVAAQTPADPAPRLDLVMQVDVALGETLEVGQTPLGHRSLVRIVGGHFAGPGLRGEVLPGGWDWQLRAGGGCTRLHADYMLRTDAGAVINVVNDARLCPRADGAFPPIWTTPAFEAPLGAVGWLNGGAYVARIEGGHDPAHPSVRILVYRPA